MVWWFGGLLLVCWFDFVMLFWQKKAFGVEATRANRYGFSVCIKDKLSLCIIRQELLSGQ